MWVGQVGHKLYTTHAPGFQSLYNNGGTSAELASSGYVITNQALSVSLLSSSLQVKALEFATVNLVNPRVLKITVMQAVCT